MDERALSAVSMDKEAVTLNERDGMSVVSNPFAADIVLVFAVFVLLDDST